MSTVCFALVVLPFPHCMSDLCSIQPSFGSPPICGERCTSSACCRTSDGVTASSPAPHFYYFHFTSLQSFLALPLITRCERVIVCFPSRSGQRLVRLNKHPSLASDRSSFVVVPVRSRSRLHLEVDIMKHDREDLHPHFIEVGLAGSNNVSQCSVQ